VSCPKLRSIPGLRDAPRHETKRRYFENNQFQSFRHVRCAYSLLSIVSQPIEDCYRTTRYQNYNGVDACEPDALEPSVAHESTPVLHSVTLKL
jgi:hypothetical protein